MISLPALSVLSTNGENLSYVVPVLENLKIRECYDGFLYLVESTRNPPKLQSHHHVELEMNLVVRGTITYVVSGKRFTFPPRTLVWLFPGHEHQLVDRADDAQCYVVVFKPSLIDKSCKTAMYEGLKQNRDQHGGLLKTQLKPDTFDLIRKIMDSLMQRSLDPDVLNHEAGFGPHSNFSFEHHDPDGLNAGLHHLLLLCWRSQRGGRVFGEAVTLHPAVQRAIKLLSDGDWEEDFGRLADACGVSEAHLSRTFHRQVGVSLTRYRNSLRLSRFWEAYRQSGQTNLAEAVYAAGFGSYAQFYKVFVQAYGKGPRACLNEQV
ncbi:MAG TPA: helix-turn-helix transcriptional regulator [Acidobacteriaceae bacterium]|nr:helix-turn-helix transcriptional regulator [Acidobacteriaceae bacterium]